MSLYSDRIIREAPQTTRPPRNRRNSFPPSSKESMRKEKLASNDMRRKLGGGRSNKRGSAKPTIPAGPQGIFKRALKSTVDKSVLKNRVARYMEMDSKNGESSAPYFQHDDRTEPSVRQGGSPARPKSVRGRGAVTYRNSSATLSSDLERRIGEPVHNLRSQSKRGSSQSDQWTHDKFNSGNQSRKGKTTAGVWTHDRFNGHDADDDLRSNLRRLRMDEE
eukprot:CFRG7636T1